MQLKLFCCWWNFEIIYFTVSSWWGGGGGGGGGLDLCAAYKSGWCLYFYGNLVPTHAPHCCFIIQLPRYQARGKDKTKSKKLEYNIIFVHDFWKSLLIPAMIIPATLIINMGDFTTPHTCFCCYWTCNSIKQCFYAIFLSPLSSLSIYFLHSDMMVIIFFYNVSIIVRWISK